MVTNTDNWATLLEARGNVEDDVIPLTDKGSYLQGGETLGEGTANPSLISFLAFNRYRQVWDTKTGQVSLQPIFLLWQTMRKMRSDGSPVFTIQNPHIAPDYGEDLTCPLSPNAQGDLGISGMGFRPCNEGRGKHHIPNQAALESHIEHSHKRAHAAIKQAKLERERLEDRAIQLEATKVQKEFMLAMMQKAATATIPALKHTHKSNFGRTVVDGCPACDAKKGVLA